MFSWMRESRRQQLLAQAFPREWNRTLDARVRHWKYLDGEKRRRIEGFAQVLLAEKDWAGGSGFELTDEMRVTIAGYAGVMTLGMVEPYYFDRLKTIIVYPGTYLPSRSRFDQYSGDLFLTARLGEAWHYGPIVLSWAEIAGPSAAARVIIWSFTNLRIISTASTAMWMARRRLWGALKAERGLKPPSANSNDYALRVQW